MQPSRFSFKRSRFDAVCHRFLRAEGTKTPCIHILINSNGGMPSRPKRQKKRTFPSARDEKNPRFHSFSERITPFCPQARNVRRRTRLKPLINSKDRYAYGFSASLRCRFATSQALRRISSRMHFLPCAAQEASSRWRSLSGSGPGPHFMPAYAYSFRSQPFQLLPFLFRIKNFSRFVNRFKQFH